MIICTTSGRIVLTKYIRVNFKIIYLQKQILCVCTVFRGTTSVNITYSCSSRDNVTVRVSYVKVQLNIMQFNLAAGIKTELEFF